MNAVHSRKGRIGLAVTLAAGLCASVGLAETESPYATGGEVTKVDLGNFRVRYIHVFTNTDEVATFKSTGLKDLSLRYLVVGGGGGGGNASASTGSPYSGGGGGGGGVCETNNVPFGADGEWLVRVGAGAKKVVSTSNPGTVAGASSISNGTEEVALVPGGGNGGRGSTATASAVPATDGAAGGGGAGPGTDNITAGAGTYPSSIFGVAYGPFAGGERGKSSGGTSSYLAGGGGGAGAAGGTSVYQKNGGNGGDGLVSDITGVELYYGSGGGAGGNVVKKGIGGEGGPRAGNGGTFVISDDKATTNFVAATMPEPNSGCGGGGGGTGVSDTDFATATDGADGIVVIRYEVAESPCEGGDVVTRTHVRGTRYTYVHIFTNTAAAAEFRNLTDRDLKLRYLVVGAGGAGGYGSSEDSDGQYSLSGGGGGGGGVCEVKNVPFAPGTRWSILVGKGAEAVQSVSKPGTAAGTSSISNETGKLVEVLGGGNGATSDTSKRAVNATDGAAGGGATTYATTSGVGNYKSSIFGDIPEGAPFDGGAGGGYTGGGGGGAAAAGTKYTTSRAGDGGKGLSSDITGESLVYGSGGGGGAHAYHNRAGGLGGTRAGNGATYEITDGGATTNFFAATAPAANSGCGGAGGMQKGYCNVATGGADGVVIIRYDYDPTPPGLMLLFK